MKSGELPLAAQGVFRTIQGEGALLGIPMTFIRIAGCSIGCTHCDTDYAVASRSDIPTLLGRIGRVTPKYGWVWITGGEPTDHDLSALLLGLDRAKYRIAAATAGHKAWPSQWPCHWLSVSPHDPLNWVQKSGDEVKIVPGLNGHSIQSFASSLPGNFLHHFVSPCDGHPGTLQECIDWVENCQSWHPQWRITTQAHKIWGIS